MNGQELRYDKGMKAHEKKSWLPDIHDMKDEDIRDAMLQDEIC